MSYYLRFEGVNLSNFIYDTIDLSTIRGGGLLLLDAVEKVQTVIRTTLPNNEPITKGASWALFELETDKSNALQIKKDIIKQLNDDEVLRHGTFVVDILEKTKDYKIDRNSLHALNRWQQMQAPSLSIPEQANAVCEYDKVRPAPVEDYSKDGKRIMLSLSVAERRKYGRGQKRGDFYKAPRTQLDFVPKFTSELGELSEKSNKNRDDERSILDGKIAVIYIDGNKFGKIVDACKTDQDQCKFDKTLRNGQNKILETLLKQANEDEVWKNADKIRLETLLWGGDELIWVVPAWLGWYTLNLFFKEANKEIRIDKTLLERIPYRSTNVELSYAAGLVFCHHNAPIHRITALARNLADLAKKDYPYKSAVAYQILKSFDHAGIEIEEHRTKRLANLAKPKDLLVTAENMERLETLIQRLKNAHFPRRKSYQFIKALLTNDSEQVNALQEKIAEDFPSIPPIIAGLKTLCGTENAHWLHLTDLWDFIA
ncbi:MAG: hypothetical protein WCP96_15070 [Methylococcaceae bacterium]